MAYLEIEKVIGGGIMDSRGTAPSGASTGAPMANNFILLILPFVYWLFMTVLLKNTEEKWLSELYGKEYAAYCRKVNRCIPFSCGRRGK